MPRESAERGSGRPRPGVAGVAENPQVRIESKFDRNLQDEIIRYLADTRSRSTHKAFGFLDEREAERAQRFSRFLARRYYRDRLHRGFRYSRSLLAASHSPDEIVDTPEFESVLDKCILGSLLTARSVGELAISQLSSLRRNDSGKELLNYELAFFLQLATSETTDAGSFPKKSVSATMHRFDLRIPDLLARLKSGGAAQSDLDGETILIFSRTPHGKIYVVEVDEKTAAVFSATDGNSSATKIGSSCALPADEIQRILAALSDIGALVLPAVAALESVV